MKRTLFFNNDESTRMSVEQLVLARPNGTDMWGYLYTSQLSVGDMLMKYNSDSDTFTPLLLESITEDEVEPRLTFAMSVDEADLFIAGNILSHNK